MTRISCEALGWCALPLVAVFALGGCADSSLRDDGAATAGTLEYSNGSLPPPGHYDLRVVLDDGVFTFTWSGYGDPVGEATGSPVDLAGARQALVDAGVVAGVATDGCPGAAYGSVDLRGGDNPVEATLDGCKGNDADVDGILDAITAIVGQDLVDRAVSEVRSS